MQELGYVIIGTGKVRFYQYDSKLSKELIKGRKNLPLRLRSVHVCQPPVFTHVAALILSTILVS